MMLTLPKRAVKIAIMDKVVEKVGDKTCTEN